MALMGKWGNTNATDEYLFYLTNTAGVYSLVLLVGNGSAQMGAAVNWTPTTGVWYHIVGRWIASTSVDLYVNGGKVSTNTSGVYANLVGSTASFYLGSQNGGGGYLGSTTFAFLAGCSLSDTHVQSLYNLTSPLFP
jgi:hypothetical protein